MKSNNVFILIGILFCLLMNNIHADEQKAKHRVIVEMPNIPDSSSLQEVALNAAFNAFSPVVDSLEPAFAKRLNSLPFIVMEIDDEALAKLKSKGLNFIEDQISKPYMDEATKLVGASKAWNSKIKGKGQALVILDTGIDTDHPAFANRITQQACFSSNSIKYKASSLCTSNQNNIAEDCDKSISGCGHGTHVSGIAAGNDKNFSGIAPEASIIAIKVFSRFDDDPTGEKPCAKNGISSPCALSFTSDQLEALRHTLKLASSQSIAAVNMSLGSGKYTSTCDTGVNNRQLKQVIDNLKSVGVATVIASGNAGFTNAIGSPACISSAISVGNTTKNDRVAFSSNSSNNLDLLAPGSKIEASVVGGKFGIKTGTSMASPVVAGAFALLKSEKPDATVDQIFKTLKRTGVNIKDLRNNLNHPRIQIDQALNEIKNIQGNMAAQNTLNSLPVDDKSIKEMTKNYGIIRLLLQANAPSTLSDKTFTPDDAKSALEDVGGALLIEPQSNSKDIVIETTSKGLDKLLELQKQGKFGSLAIDELSKPM